MYVSLSLLRSSSDEVDMKRRILTIIQANEGEEFLNYFPNYREVYFEVVFSNDLLLILQQKALYDGMINYMNQVFDEHFAHVPEKKLIGQLAIEKNIGFVALIYRLYDRQTTALEFVSELQLQVLEANYLFPFIELGCIPAKASKEGKSQKKKKATVTNDT